MKKIFFSTLIIIAALLILPLSLIKKSTIVTAQADSQKISATTEKEYFKLYITSSKKIENISTSDYLFGVVAAEMPALYEKEALKSQAVAAYTFAKYRSKENSEKGYDITDDFNTDQSYITESQAREKWGDNAEEYCKKIKDAIDEASGYILTYKGLPCLTVYHAISSGRTESAKDIWGGDYQYLSSVTSAADKLSPNYKSTVKLTEKELVSKLSPNFKISGEESKYFQSLKRTDSGTVKELLLCGNKISGAEIRNALDLRSSNFEINYTDNSFTFTVYGYGHGVGMSQYGANAMAKQGADFKEILNHYYSGCSLDKTK